MISYLFLIAGLVLLVFSGDVLVKGSVNLARHFKISSLKIGLTVVAFGTSAPELFVSVKSAYNGLPDLALGNIVGSNIANIGLIAGAVALILPIAVKDKAIIKDFWVMIFATLLLLISVAFGKISPFVGIVFILLLLFYIYNLFRFSKEKDGYKEEILPPEFSMFKSFLYVIFAVVGLYFGAELLIDGAVDIAKKWGVNERIIGISLVAIGTSLPELITSLVAIYRKENDISLGNLVGSNIFNIFAVLGATSVVSWGIDITSVSQVVVDIVISLIFAILLFLFILPVKKGKISRIEGLILLSLYVAYMIYLFNN